jgi:hypothetical protein
MGKQATIPWEKIDPYFLAGARNCDIREKFGISNGACTYRRRQLGILGERSKIVNEMVKFIPPEDRLEQALKFKADALNLTVAQLKSNWLTGTAGKQFLQSGGY